MVTHDPILVELGTVLVRFEQAPEEAPCGLVGVRATVFRCLFRKWHRICFFNSRGEHIRKWERRCDCDALSNSAFNVEAAMSKKLH